jgi:prenyltransferase beta subunit
LYCADCKLPASKRTFWSLHNHEQHKKEDVSTKSSETETLAAEISLSRIVFEAASRFVAQKEEEDAKKRTAIVDVEECKESSSSLTSSSGGSHAASSTNAIW